MASTTSVIPATYAQAPASPRFPHTESSPANRAIRVARERLGSPSSSSSSVDLVGREPPSDFPGKLSKAYKMLQSEEYKAAQELFAEILEESKHPTLEVDSLIPAHCHLGIAFSLTGDKSKKIAEALESLNFVLHHNRWFHLDPEQKSKAYLELRSCNKLALLLLSDEESKQLRQMHIGDCSKYILPLDEFNEKVREADRCAAKMEPQKARQLYHEALSLDLEPNPHSEIARVICSLNYASTFIESANPKRIELLADAEGQLDGLFDNRGILGNQLRWTSEKLFTTFVDLLTKLHTLMPEEYDGLKREKIQHRINFCKAYLPNRSEEESEDFRPRRRVSSGYPDRSGRPAAIFARFLILGLAVVGVVALFRRYVIKVG